MNSRHTTRVALLFRRRNDAKLIISEFKEGISRRRLAQNKPNDNALLPAYGKDDKMGSEIAI